MIENMLTDVSKIYIAYGYTDFRKQTHSLCAMIKSHYNYNPYDQSAYIFCNKHRTSIKVLCFDKNGMVLAQKVLLGADKMKFQWPKDSNEMKNITKKQLRWLLSGLSINEKRAFNDYNLTE